jgi:pSer/pThr/pTyr-binding forkhead associated (FHA) protein
MIKVLLIVVQGKPEGKTIPLTGPTFKIGRSEACHLRPNSDLISREHAEISLGEEAATIKDLGSRNGTMLNGRTLTGTAILKSGDLVQIGHLTFAVAIQGAAVVPPTSTKPAAAAGAGTLDDVSHAEIESWLIADNNRPTPDRPSGVYDGDTLTINAYRGGAGAKGTPADQTPPAPAAPPVEEPRSPLGEDMTFEQLPEGEGDIEPDEDTDIDEEEGGAGSDVPEEFIDESNPFYAAKKAQKEEPAKPTYKDSSDAANDILKKLLDRRRSGKP